MIPKNHKKQTSARPFPRRAPAMLAALLAGIPLSFHPLANPAARADGVTVSSDSSLKTEMESLTAGGTVSFTGAGTNSVLAAPVTLTANPYVLNPGGAAHVTLTGNNATGVFENTAATAADGTINLVLSNIAITDALGSSAIRSSAGAVNITLAGAAGTTELARNRNNGSDNAAPTFGGAAYGYTGITITGSQENLVLADNYGPRRGGGLYAENKTITINPVLSGTLLVTSNTANNSNGGAFSLAQSGTVILSGTHKDILIQNNYCRNGQGGAISSGGALLIAPRVSGTFLVTSNSIASSGNGGAFYSQDAMTITANGPAGIRFENNAAVGVGGALCVNASRIITLDAREGDIVFQGNVHTADKVPNAIYGNAGGGTHNGNNTLVIQGGRDVLFFDPVYASGTAEPLNTLLKTGAGTVLFSGSNSWRGSSTVSAGALLVNDGALL
ncbi:MAG: autotransporter-associated beta strand repeat-containing protein, partial [Opitutaceae bacterium]|nr:autotransporter-associated beta strand repeat-containing protein [Opitutaceae bacterium]